MISKQLSRAKWAAVATAISVIAVQLPTAAGAGSLPVAAPQQQSSAAGSHDMGGYGIPTGAPQQIAMFMYPGMTALDFVGPQTIFATLGNVRVHFVSKDKKPVLTDTGLTILPSDDLESCPKDLTVLFVPGGGLGTVAAMKDPETLAFLKDRGSRAKYVTSVCTGSLILGAAGLLNGYKATSHWVARDVLSSLGATPVNSRVVEDRNRITGAGVTAGIDFALVLAQRLRNDKMARGIQLMYEYAPSPPFQSGTPEQAPQDIVAMIRAMYGPVHSGMIQAAKDAAQKSK
jgi:cyclohexyl-isocyanide hydratase